MPRSAPLGGRARDQEPQDIEAEAAALGSILIDPEAIIQVADYLLSSHFYRDAHRTIFHAALDLYEQRKPADLITLCDQLERMDKLEEVGGSSYVSSLANYVPTSANVDHYARIVMRHAASRELQKVCRELVAKAWAVGADPLALASEYEKRIWAVHAAREPESDGNGHDKSVLFSLLTDREAEDLKPLQGILGNILFEDSLAFLYGRSGWWKSSVALSWALCIGAEVDWLGKKVVAGDVVYVSAEGARGIGKRITAWKKRHGLVGQSVRLHVLGVPVLMLRPGEVERLIRSIKAKASKPILVVIDTLARAMAGRDENNTQDAGALIAAADTIRVEFGCCVLFVHHLG